jgi:hypothetical protein
MAPAVAEYIQTARLHARMTCPLHPLIVISLVGSPFSRSSVRPGRDLTLLL